MGATEKRKKLKEIQKRVVIEQRRPLRPLAASLLDRVEVQRHNRSAAEALVERYRPGEKP